MIWRRMGLILGLGLMLGGLPMPRASAEPGPFDQALFQYTQDGALDGREYVWLQQLGQSSLPYQDQALARQFLAFAARYRGFIRMTYTYYRDGNPIKLNFAFAPTYSEDSVIQGSSSRELLSQISQNDVLSQTRYDSERCGAAALLAAHYLLYGSFSQAFALLNIQTPSLTYRAMHQAQETLYQLANTDGEAGLVSMFHYSLYSDGAIDKPVPDGEIKDAAQRILLRVSPMIGPRKETMTSRLTAIQRFWNQYPDAVFLVGVHLNEKTGSVRAPDPSAPQNHFVLIFRQDNRLWMLNSGVLDNGNRSALTPLDVGQAQGMFYHTDGSVDALTRM